MISARWYEAINTLMSRRYRFSAAFGPEADKPFRDLSAAIEQVLSASSILMDMANVSEKQIPPEDTETWAPRFTPFLALRVTG